MLQTLLSYAWAIPIILAVVFYKFTLRVFFGMVIIPENKIGLVTKKFVLFGANKKLPDGKIIALNGEPGFQADTLAPGLYWGYWVWQYSIDHSGLTEIPKGKIGLVSSNFGKQLGWDETRINKLIYEMTSGDYENLLQVFDREFGTFVILER